MVSLSDANKIETTVSLADSHAMTARNNIDSPFVRLPGEIRNIIYKHVFDELSDLVICVHDVAGPRSPPKHRLVVCKAVTSDSYDPRSLRPFHWNQICLKKTYKEYTLLAKLCQLIFTCRLVYSETHRLPLQLPAFDVLNDEQEFVTLCEILKPGQVNLIARIEMTSPRLREYTRRFPYEKPNTTHNCMHGSNINMRGFICPEPVDLERFTGLNSVRVTGCPRSFPPNGDYGIYQLETILRHCGAREGVKVECVAGADQDARTALIKTMRRADTSDVRNNEDHELYTRWKNILNRFDSRNMKL
ncbi:hypothetical protein FB567DRAFT_549256 [Paraphoma chrysanthemicola]|uniref:DUF7730 domain-containing protein n=1 Tax=Paraphoma chrysanthemicola TaxID=798071 RepID=A0A8K0R4H6_9PLEO|nr:hypothetical protein FB567DRAFT_549256 [Paraphoma chrysanthemicola]